jgi:hypothetical protein
MAIASGLTCNIAVGFTSGFNPAARDPGANFADAFMRNGKLDIDLLAKGLGQLAGKDPAYAAQIFDALSAQFGQLSAREQGTFERLFNAEIANAAPGKGRAAQPASGKTTEFKTQYGTFKVSPKGTLTPDKFRSQPMSTPEFKLWKDVHDGLMRNKDPEMGTSAAEDVATRWIFYSEGKISIDQISTLNQLLGGSKATEKALAEYSSQGIPLNATFELPQHAPLRYFTEYKVEQKRLENALDVQARQTANPSTTTDQHRVAAAIAQNARAGVDISWKNFELSKTAEGRVQLEFQHQNSPEVREANAKAFANTEVNKLLAIAFAGPVIGAGAALLPEALALYRGGQMIKAGLTGLAGTEQVTGGLNTLRTGGESQTGIAGGLINAVTGTRAGDTISLVIQLSPELYGVVAMGKAAMTTYPSKAAALKAADALDETAFKTGQIKDRAPAGTEREILQTPEVKAQLAKEAEAKAAAEAAEAELKANEIIVTAKVNYRNPDGSVNLDRATKKYAEVVNSNKQWKWDKKFPSAEFTRTEQRNIKFETIARGLIPDVPYKAGTKYADFEKAGLVVKIEKLPEELWKASDSKQFNWLDARIPGGRPEGMSWHHSEIEGQMELVPFGIHNITDHIGGRSPGHWAYGNR